jgi:hypothetical protein
MEPGSNLQFTGRFVVEHWRDGKHIATHELQNGVTIEGKNFNLDVYFHGTTAAPTWWLGLIDNDSYVALAEGDTYDDIDQAGNGWDEYQDYTDANNTDSTTTRPEFIENAASAKSITNGTQAIYDIVAPGGTVKGIFAVGLGANADLKGDHANDGKLWATALFTGGDVVVATSDQLKVTYTVST